MRIWVRIATPALAALLGGACGRGEWCWPPNSEVQCHGPTSATATLVAPEQYGPPTAFAVTAWTCLERDGTCSVAPQIMVSAAFQMFQAYTFALDITLPAGGGPATYAISAPGTTPPSVQGNFDGTFQGDWVPFTAATGAIIVDRSTGDELKATFDLQLATADQLAFTVSGGTVDVSGCEVVQLPGGCTPMD
jgi:hypothetical protein